MRNSGAAIFFFFIVVYFPVAYCVLFFAAHFSRGGSSPFCGGSSLFNFCSKFPNPILRRLVTFLRRLIFFTISRQISEPKIPEARHFQKFSKFPNPILRRLVTFHHARQFSEPNFPLRHRHRMRRYSLHRHPPPPHFSTFRRVEKIVFSHEPLDFFLIVRC